MDWSVGEYERTANELEGASSRVIDAMTIGPGMRLLDLGSGTGNAAIAAARRGAEVLAVDPAERLLEVCRARAERESLAVRVQKGDASRIPADDASFDAVVSLFGVIFAQDAQAAASEMLRVVRPGGRVVLTSWTPEGAIWAIGKVLRHAMASANPEIGARPPPAWGDPIFVRELFERRGAKVRIEDASMTFERESPTAWFEEQEQYHPLWLMLRGALESVPGAWEQARARGIEVLTEESEDPSRFLTTSHYLIVTATRGDR